MKNNHSTQSLKLVKPTHDYIGRKACGCVVAVCMDMGDRHTAKTIGEFIVDGLKVERYAIGSPELNAILDNLGCKCQRQQDAVLVNMENQTQLELPC